MTENNKNFNLAVNHKYFASSLVKFLKFIDEKSKNIISEYVSSFERGEQSISDYKMTNKYKSHKNIQTTCENMIRGFDETTDEKEKYDQGKIIKRIYKTITQNIDKFYPEHNISLFQLRNEKNEIITIIPGLDIYQVVRDKNISDDEINKMWSYLYAIYISAANMIMESNKNKKESKTWENLPGMRKKMVELCDNKEDLLFNPYIGLNTETGEYDIDTMYSNLDNMPSPTGINMGDVMKMGGLDKMLDMEQLKTQLNDIKDEDIDIATKEISNLIGGKDDSDTQEICGDLVRNVVQELQQNKDGNLDFFGIANSVAQKLGKSKMQNEKYQKTANQFKNFMSSGQDKLKNMKDEKGNPVGQQLFNQLNMFQMMAQMGQQEQQGSPGSQDDKPKPKLNLKSKSNKKK